VSAASRRSLCQFRPFASPLPSRRLHARNDAVMVAPYNAAMNTVRTHPMQIEPHLTVAEREELAHLAYFLAQLEALRARDLIAPEAYRAVSTEYAARRDNIERHGQVEAALSTARALSRQSPQDAMDWAEQARQLDAT